MDPNVDMNQTKWEWGKLIENPFDDPNTGLEFNLELEHEYRNTFGMEIYKRPLKRWVYKTAKHNTPFTMFLKVNFQGDMYIGKDGAKHIVTKHLAQVDAFGVLQT